MSRRLKASDATATYCRSYLVTLGLAFVALSIFIWHRDGSAVSTWPWWGLAVVTIFSSGGVGLVLFGLFGPSSKMEGWAEGLSRHEASLIIMALAYPVHLVLAPFYKQR